MASRFFATRLPSVHPTTLRAAWWAGAELRVLRRTLSRSGLDTPVSRPPAAPPHAIRGVRGVLLVGRASCLERSLVLQRWLAEHGKNHDLLVGVDPGGGDFRAHAWLDGYDGAQEEYTIISRRPAPSQPVP